MYINRPLLWVLLVVIFFLATPVLAQNNETIAKSHYLNAVAKYDAGEYAEALKSFNKVVELMGSSNPNTQYYLIKSHLALRKPILVKDSLLGAYFDKYPHAETDPMYQEMLMLVSSIDEIIGQTYKELLEEKKQNIIKFVEWDVKNAYKPSWNKMLLNGALFKKYESLQKSISTYRHHIKNENWKTDIVYKGYYYDEIFKGFLGSNYLSTTYKNSTLASSIKDWSTYKINYEPVIFKNSYNSSGKDHYLFSSKNVNGASVEIITFAGRFNNNNYVGSTTSDLIPFNISDNNLNLYKIDGSFLEYNGDKKTYVNNVALSLFALDKENNSNKIAEIKYKRVRITTNNAPKNEKYISLYLEDEYVGTIKNTGSINGYILVGTGYVRFYLPGSNGHYTYYAKKLKNDYTKAYFFLYNECYKGEAEDLRTVEMSVGALNINHIVDLFVKRNNILIDVTDVKPR